MTQPLRHGFPDFGRQMAASDILVESRIGYTISGATLFPVRFTGNMTHIAVACTAISERVEVEISWYTTEAQDEFIGSDIIVTSPGGVVFQCVTARGPFMQAIVRLSAYPDDIDLIIYMVGAPFAEVGSGNGHNALLTIENQTVGAASTYEEESFQARGGWAYWHGVMRGATSATVTLYAVDANANRFFLDVMGPDISTQGRSILLPAMPILISATNNDGVDRDLYASVLHLPFLP